MHYLRIHILLSLKNFRVILYTDTQILLPRIVLYQLRAYRRTQRPFRCFFIVVAQET